MIGMSACVDCKNYRDKLKCLAFSDRIPKEMLIGRNDHTEPYEGDNGIQFEPIED